MHHFSLFSISRIFYKNRYSAEQLVYIEYIYQIESCINTPYENILYYNMKIKLEVEIDTKQDMDEIEQLIAVVSEFRDKLIALHEEDYDGDD